MDNLTSSPASCVIKLDQSQYTFYQKSYLEIHSPEGKTLTVIGNPLSDKTDVEAVYQLWNQACLLEVMFDDVKRRTTLPPKAIHRIAYVIDRIDLHLKQ